MNLLSKEIKDKVEFLDFKLKGGITSLSILEWLNNFNEEDKDDMLNLLLYMEYIKSDEIFDLYDSMLSDDFFNGFVNNELVVFNPIGPYEKSGTAMVYYINKVMRNKKGSIKANYVFASNASEIKKQLIMHNTYKDKTLILFDDILGSGQTTIDYVQELSKTYCCIWHIFSKIVVVALVATDDSINNIKSDFPNLKILVGMKREKIFSDKKLILNSKEERTLLRDKCYKYGDYLCENSRNIKPLGYDNSQTLITFSYGTPNNTLPIIWWSNQNWIPLAPRYIQDRINTCRSERKKIARIIGAIKLLNDIDFISLVHSEEFEEHMQKYEFDKVALLVWLNQRVDETIIAQRLCLSVHDMECLFNELVGENYIDSKLALTQKGQKYVSLAQKYLYDIKKYDNKHLEFKNVTYVPTTFRGLNI